MKQLKGKRFVAVFMAVMLVLTFGLAACADGGAAGTPAATGSGDRAAGGAGEFAQKVKDIDKDSLTIAFIPLGASGATIPLHMEGFEDAIGGRDIKIEMYDSQFDVTTQLNLMNECITQGVDAIILQPADSTSLNGVMSEAEAAGIPVMTLNTGADGARTVHCLNSNDRSGQEAAQYIYENAGKPDDAKVIILDVVPELKPNITMGTAFQTWMEENTNWELIDIQGVPDTSQENGNTIMRDLLTKHDQIDIVYTVNDDVAVGAIQAIESAGRQDEGIVVWGYEGHPNGLTAIKEGRMYGTSYADVYQQSFSMMMMLLWYMQTGVTGERLGFEYYPVVEYTTTIVTKDNIDEVLKRTHWDM